MAEPSDQQAYSVVLSLKIHLNLVNYCLICGTSLKEGLHSNSSNLVNPLNHILSSPCFLKNNGAFGVKDIQLFQDGNENTEVNMFGDKIDIKENQNFVTTDLDEKENCSDTEEEWGDTFEELIENQDENETKGKTMRELALPKYNCEKCEAFFPSNDSLRWHDDLTHQPNVGYQCSICTTDFLTLEVLTILPLYLQCT